MSKNNLGDRMKQYENIERRYLMSNNPTLIRLDGKAFHSFTKGFERPFDMILMKTMWKTAQYLCQNIMGCKVAYVQSDEITLLLNDYENINTEAWFKKNIQKMCSVSASMATMFFNKEFLNIVQNVDANEISDQINVYYKRFYIAMFDSRVFNIPREEVCNAFIWRQQDATRNAIQMIGQANFSHKELQNKKCSQIQEKLFQEKGINFNDLPVYQRRGACIIKEYYDKDGAKRSRWIVDRNIPIFTQDRDYIGKYVYI